MTTLSQIHAPAFAVTIALLAIGPVAADEVPVTIVGSVTVNGKPLADGTIIFNLDDSEFVGTRIKDGKYKVTRVPAGKWLVTIRSDELPTKDASKNAAEFRVEAMQGMSIMDFDVKRKK